MISVGLTGNIGCGKSTVARMFEERGAACIDADAIVHELLAPEGAELPAGNAHVRFDPAHTRIYADGWMKD